LEVCSKSSGDLRQTGAWLLAAVVEPLLEGHVTVEYQLNDGRKARKTVLPSSQDLRHTKVVAALPDKDEELDLFLQRELIPLSDDEWEPEHVPRPSVTIALMQPHFEDALGESDPRYAFEQAPVSVVAHDRMQRYQGCWHSQDGLVAWISGRRVIFTCGETYQVAPDDEDGLIWRQGELIFRATYREVIGPDGASKEELSWDARKWYKQPGDGRLQSVILKDGTYMPGRGGGVWSRRKRGNRLFAKSPELFRKIQEHPSSRRWYNDDLLNFDDKLEDGFRACFGREILLFDPSVDASLCEFVGRMRACLSSREAQGFTVAKRVQMIAKEVETAFGGPPAESVRIKARLTRRIDEGPVPPEDFPIGALIERPRERKGAGICRHRSFMFKFLCDTLDITKCAALGGIVAPEKVELIKRWPEEDGGVVQDHMWNVVKIDGKAYIMDCMSSADPLSSSDRVLTRSKGILAYKRLGGRAGLESLASF